MTPATSDKKAGRHAALQDGPVDCTLRRAGGLHIDLGCRKGRAGGLPEAFLQADPSFSAARQTALLCSQADRLRPAGPDSGFLNKNRPGLDLDFVIC